MDESTTQSCAVELPDGGKLILFTQEPDTIPTVAAEVNELLAWLGTPEGFTVHLWWRDDPRTLGADEWPTKRSVNGGWTMPGSNVIYVYRKEEYDRVLIHETIHAMGWDWKMPTTPLPCWGLEGGQTMPHLFEAWTELYAEWLWCGWHSVPWETQRRWQDYQATQILARLGRSGAPQTWQENTNVFAYYVLKAALAPHVEFLWVFGNGKTPQEKQYVMCGLVTPELDRLRALAKHTVPQDMSLRMSVPDILDGLKR